MTAPSERVIPYGRQTLEDDDIAAVVEVLRSDWLTTGPKVGEFEKAFAEFVGAREGVALSNGTAALHAAAHALGIGPGDEVIVPPMTFVATANAVLYQGGTPVFADVDAGTLLLDPAEVKRKITPRTKAIFAVDYAGQPCDYDALRAIADRHGLKLLADACHAVGAELGGKRAGALADVTVFSFHPVKHLTTGEGGMVTTDDPEIAKRVRTFRSHGITSDHRQRAENGSFHYDMVELGYNYRITDFQCALGLSQLKKQERWLARREEVARRYDEAFRDVPGITPLASRTGVRHAYHLYVVRVDAALTSVDRGTAYQSLRAMGVAANVHYIPVHLHPYYKERFGYKGGECPVAEAAYQEILSLPMYPAMTDADIDTVIAAVRKSANA